MAFFLAVQAMLVLGFRLPPVFLWLLFGFGGTACILPSFLAAFAVQWGVEAIIGVWPQTEAGGYAPAGYQAGFGMVLLLQVIGAVWFGVGRPGGMGV